MNQGFWMAKGVECLNDGEIAYDNSSRLDPKRSHQWFMDSPEAELFPNKKQEKGVPSSNHFSGLLNSNVPVWGHTSSFHSISGPFGERLFDSPATRAGNFDDQNVTSVTTEKIHPGRKIGDDLFGNDSSFGLSMSQAQEDHRAGLSYGIRKVKVSQVKDSENVMAVSMGHSYDTVDSNTISMSHAYSKADDSSITMDLAYNKGDPEMVSIGDTFVRENNIYISMAQPYNKGNDNISIGQIFKDNNDGIQMAHPVSKVDNNIISLGQSYNKVDDNIISMGHIYNKGDDSTISMDSTYNKDGSSSLSIGHSYTKGESTIISFGEYNEDDANPSGTLLPTYGAMIGRCSVNTSEAMNQKAIDKSNADTLISSQHVTVSGAENNSRKKEDLKTSKKAPSNNFPSNVRSLLSTGMLDGVPVKYIAWSREELRGVIKGSGYQCSCQSCNYSKVINAYEFERHAGCKTKHPNNHIYFENGKTIYGIVQELRSTPQNMLFEVIQTITGSQINLKSFRLWKESFLAATRELQRIYGKEEGKPLS